MNKINSALLILTLTASILTAALTAQASTPKSSVPTFTLKLIDNSYDVPPETTTTTDPYTGKQTVHTQRGYRVQNLTIEVAIKNQQFTPYPIDDQHTANLFYNVSYKGHYEPDWTYYLKGDFGRDYHEATDIPQSTSDYTVVQIRAPNEGEMDFRVQAQIGYYTTTELNIAIPGGPFTVTTFTGEASGWSDTQTITIDANGSTSTPNTSPPQNSTSTPEPQEQEQPQSEPFLTALVAVVSVVSIVLVGIGLLVYFKKRNHKGE